jgi:hypothetical protein
MKIKLIAICEKIIEVPDGFKGSLDAHKEMMQDESIGIRLVDCKEEYL